MDAQELTALTLHELSRRIQARELSPIEVVEAFLARIEEVNPALNAFLTVCAEEARAEAAAAEREIAAGRIRGPLHGVPYGAKDIVDTAGVRTTHGASFFRDHVPAEDAECIRRLKEAGAILLGKLNTHEFAAGSTTRNPHFGPCRNPWDLERVPGGSSGGSGAAVAAGLCPVAIGSDTGGSIRGPAAACGVAGLKPTYGRVSLRGVFPNAPSLDVAGPLARTARDCGLFLGGMAGFDPLDPGAEDVPVPDFCAEVEAGVEGLRLGLCEALIFGEIDAAVRKGLEGAAEALARLGAEVVTVDFPMAGRLPALRNAIADAEVAEVHRGRLEARPEGFGGDVRERLERACRVTLDEYIRASRERRLLRRAMRELFRTVDALVLPTYPCPAAPIETLMGRVNGREVPFQGLGRATNGVHNVSGHPAVAVPSGYSPEGLPVSVQFVGRPWEESRILRIAHAYETATPEIRARRPAVVQER